MCGRFTLTLEGGALAELFGFVGSPDWAPRYNIAPCQNILGIRNKIESANTVREAVRFRWGLVPRWAKDTKGGAMMINARSETAREKPAFRALVKSRRCLVPADGFYEWKIEEGIKRPYWFSFPGRRPFVFAGLWESYLPPTGAPTDSGKAMEPVFPLETCTILTTQAQGWLSEFHERMPVLIEKEDWSDWLDVKQPIDPIWERLVGAFPGRSMVPLPVSTRVNRVSEEGPGLLEVFASSPPSPTLPKITKKRREPDQPGLFD